MHVTDIALSRTLGITLLPEGNGPILAMAEAPALLNHIGTVIAGAQFTLAEAASGEFLLQQLGGPLPEVLAVLRHAEVKFRKPAHGTLQATARFAEGDPESILAGLATHGRVLPCVLVDVTDGQGVVVMTGRYHWVLQKQRGEG